MFRCLARFGVVVVGLTIVVCWGCAERPAKKAEPGAKEGQPAAPKPEEKQPAQPAPQETKPPETKPGEEVKPKEPAEKKPKEPAAKDVKPDEKKPEEPAPAEAGPTSGRGGRAVGRVFRRLIEGSGAPGLRSTREAPRRIMPPAIDAKEAGKKALTQYDLDGDGAVGAQELDKAPALKAAVKNLDRNDDGKITAEEITARIKAWQDSKVGLMSLVCLVTLDGKPVEGAKVTLAPERFLGTEIKPATGVSDENGIANLTIPIAPDSDLPSGMACGLYRVQVSWQKEGKELIPARYNTQTTLGREVALDAEGMQEGMLRFDLTSQ